MKINMKMKFNDFLLLESAPRLPKDINYWLRKGKSGKNVCLITHDDLDGIVSAIIMKNWLQNNGFKIKKYGIINYQEGWKAFEIDTSLITIALDFAEDFPGVDYYVDHHGDFSEELKNSQKSYSIKTKTGSAAEGIAQQLGIPFSNDTKDWIDMIDSAKYSDYDVDIRGILDFNLSKMTQSKNAKLEFAASMNQLMKRSDHKTIIEVINASQEPSIYNIFRLFKIFYPKNNPDFRTGVEPDFLDDARDRLSQMKKRTKGDGLSNQGFDASGKKIRYTSQSQFWKDFSKNLPYINTDDNGELLYPDKDDPRNYKWQLKPGVYQIIGNLMYVPSGTWANALRAKAIFTQDVDDGIIPNDTKLNFVLLQYGNTLQIADLSTKIQNMDEDDLPKDKNGETISNLGKYTENLVENFKKYLGYNDDRTVAGGHLGIGSISNIFGKCKMEKFKDVKFLDMFKNKIINDISGVAWNLNMPWNEADENQKGTPSEVNKKMVDIENVRTENEVRIERDEMSILNYLIINNITDRNLTKKFKNDTVKKLYEIWIENGFKELTSGSINNSDVTSLYFKNKSKIEKSDIFNSIIDKFNLNDIYNIENTSVRGIQRKDIKRLFIYIFNILNKTYIKKDTLDKFKKFKE